MSDEACTWPEQDIVESWLEKYGIVIENQKSYELKQAFTKTRIEKDKQIQDLNSRVNVLISTSTNTHEVDVLVQGLVSTLEELARLGGINGNYGNSDGNIIAIAALDKYRRFPVAQTIAEPPHPNT